MDRISNSNRTKDSLDPPTIPSHWEGDYIPSEQDFLDEAAKPSPGPLYNLKNKHSLGPTIYWSLVIILSTVFHWQYGNRWHLSADYDSIFIQGSYWKLWTSLFIHADLSHLLSNLWLFGVFGYLLRAFWGQYVFPIISFIVLGGLTTLLTIASYGPGPRLLGASGMIYGMIGIWLVTYCRFELRYTLKIRLFRATGFVLLMLFPTTITKNVSYAAHSYGFLIGLSIGIILLFTRREEKMPTPI